MSAPLPPYRIGSFNVHCFHDCAQAAAIHAELKKLHIDAAVVDHAFILSPLQLAVALFRIESIIESTPAPSAETNISASLASVPPPPQRRPSFSRRVFAALSLTHNLDRIMQILPPGPLTRSIVILYRSPTAAAQTPLTSPVRIVEDVENNRRCISSSGDGTTTKHTNAAAADAEVKEAALEAAIHSVVRATNPAAFEHCFHEMCVPFWCSPAVQYVEVAKVMKYYSVTETMMAAAQHSLTRRDEQHVCSAAEDASVEAQQRALRWYTLQLCVTTQLAACMA